MKTFFISDTHFSHRNIIRFTDQEGKLIRPFETLEEMDELMVDNWNRVVGDKDRIYHMGDVVINRRALIILNRLKGRKCLIRGNHDIFKLKDYIPYFDDIRSYKIMPALGIIFSHIPLHINQLQGRWKANAHGHMHQNKLDDDRYMNLCVENINYTPIELEEIISKYKERNIDLKEGLQ